MVSWASLWPIAMTEAPRPHILVIDQEPSVLELIRELLEEEGFTVSTRRHADPDLREIKRLAPSLIVLDPLWPAEPADASLLQRLRWDGDTRAIPIVLCTGDASDAEAQEVAFIPKPFDIAGFLEVIRETLHGSATDEASGDAETAGRRPGGRKSSRRCSATYQHHAQVRLVHPSFTDVHLRVHGGPVSWLVEAAPMA